MNWFHIFIAPIFLIGYSEYRRVIAQVVDGDTVERIEDYPFMVGLYRNLNSTHYGYTCGGTIVSHWKVVTAAHCVFKKTSFNLRFGLLSFNERYDYRTMNVDENDIIIHPKYSKEAPHNNDIAVIQLKERLSFDARVNKIEMLDENYVPKTMDKVTMLGYTKYDNTTERDGEDNNYYLQIVNSTIHDFEDCRVLYSKNDNCFKELFKKEVRLICVALRKGRENKKSPHNTNRGDSGSPIITPDRKFLGLNSLYILKYPEICVLIPAYRDFIASPRAISSSAAEENGRLIFNIQDHPYMAALLYTKISIFSNTPYISCGATIISSSKILTIASCVQDIRSLNLLVSTINTDEPYYQLKISRQEIHIHPKYNKSTFANNIALLELKTPLKFGPKKLIGKIDMIDRNRLASIRPGKDVFVLGYTESKQYDREYTDTHLRYMNAKIVNFGECRKLYAERNKKYVLDEKRQFCITFGGNSTTAHFYGGPVIARDSKNLLGSIANDLNGLPKIVSSVIGHRAFIDSPRDYREVINESGKFSYSQNFELRGRPAGSTSQPIETRKRTGVQGVGDPSIGPSRQTVQSTDESTTDGTLVDNIEGYKYMVGLKDDGFLCSAAILTNYQIIAAAHCLRDKKFVNLILGSLNLGEPFQTQNFTDKQIILHPAFNSEVPCVNDIAVIQLKIKLKFGPKIGKLDIIDRNYVAKPGDNVTMLAYVNNRLHTINSTIGEFESCRSSYQERNNDDPQLEKERQFCITFDGKYDGGPVIKGNKIIGIVSNGIGDGFPEVCSFTNGYREFITNPRIYSMNYRQNQKPTPKKKSSFRKCMPKS
ncbi:uncharacterized protein LOC116346741 [Contarinia nasturtii]|uniref:uncharacterized protein LOC116346741 n=1 Tax=Contarinia nasturtii TaxID=265458 RepID=UPI0012D4A3BD|nr:uncharacterized protein LOC116346741 [Contarinia nasturtii]